MLAYHIWYRLLSISSTIFARQSWTPARYVVLVFEDRPTDQPTDLGIEAPSRSLEINFLTQAQNGTCFQEEAASASVCVPTLGAPECSAVTLKGVEVVEKEKCLSITRTVCTEGEGE